MKLYRLENDYSEQLNEEVEKQTRMATERADRLEELSDEMVQTLAVTIDAKDRYTNGHSFRVSRYAVRPAAPRPLPRTVGQRGPG